MNSRSIFGYALILAGYVFLLAPSYGADPRSPETLAAIRGTFERWLAADGLSENLEVQKVRWGARADDPSAQWLKLELRFISQGTNQDIEDYRFQQWLGKYHGIAGITLPEALFFKLVHAAKVPRTDVYVAIGVLSRTFEAMRDRTSARIVFRETKDRLIRHPLMLEGIVEPAPERKAEARLHTGAASIDLSRRVQRYLQDYFSRSNQMAGLKPPKLSLKPLEPDYAGIEVEGIRKLVLTEKNYWEQLQISIEIRNDNQQPRAVCYLDGKYAAGLGSRLPAADAYTDMDPAFRQQLERFVETLLRGLQDHLASGAN